MSRTEVVEGYGSGGLRQERLWLLCMGRDVERKKHGEKARAVRVEKKQTSRAARARLVMKARVEEKKSQAARTARV